MAFHDLVTRPAPLLSRFVGMRRKRVIERTAVPGRAFEMVGTAELAATAEFRRDPAGSLMTILFGTLALFIAFGLWFGTFAKQETMRGYVTAASGATRIASTAQGTVGHVWVKQGDIVKAGQRLVTIVPQQSAAGGGSLAEADITALETERANLTSEIARVSELLDRDAGDRIRFDADESALDHTLRAQETRLVAALAAQDADVAKLRRYLRQGYATRDQLAAYESRLLDIGRQLADTRMRIAEFSSTVTQRRRDLDRSHAQTANDRSTMTSRLDDIDARLKRSKAAVETDVLAATDGQVAAINIREGGTVAAGDTLVALADPSASVRVALEAPSSAIGLVRPGQRVVLKYDAFPFKTFGIQYGHVTSVGEAPLALPKSLEASGPANASKMPQSTFLVEVEPEHKAIRAYGEDRPIVIGSTLSADVVVERRRLIDWVLDPILAMRGRL